MVEKTIKYFDWFDIQKEICKEMGIDENQFRDYHQVIGGKYKDLWHEWLEYFDSEVKNDTITNCELGERIECKLEWVKEDSKEWLEPFVNAIYKIWDDYGIEYVKYCW